MIATPAVKRIPITKRIGSALSSRNERLVNVDAAGRRPGDEVARLELPHLLGALRPEALGQVLNVRVFGLAEGHEHRGVAGRHPRELRVSLANHDQRNAAVTAGNDQSLELETDTVRRGDVRYLLDDRCQGPDPSRAATEDLEFVAERLAPARAHGDAQRAGLEAPRARSLDQLLERDPAAAERVLAGPIAFGIPHQEPPDVARVDPHPMAFAHVGDAGDGHSRGAWRLHGQA